MRPRGCTILVTRNLGRRAPTAHSLSSCVRLGQRRNFSPSSMRLARDWEMSSLCYEPVLIPSSPMWDWWTTVCVVRGAWCVLRGVCCRCTYIVVLGAQGLCCSVIIRGEAFVNRFASFSASASAPMDPNLRIHQLQPTATRSSPVKEKAHHSCPGLLAQESLCCKSRTSTG